MKTIDTSESPTAHRRREPSQQRAQFTVEAIVEAAQQLMAEHGAQALTTRRIAERAGVSIGSLYQYFPNREAIIARLLEPFLFAAAERGAKRYTHQLNAEEFFIEAYCGQIELEKNLANVDSETFAQHQKYLMWDWFTDKLKVSPQRRRENMEQFLRKNSPALNGKQFELASFMLTTAIPSTIDALAGENPALLHEETLKEILSAMVRSILVTVDSCSAKMADA
jgi:AcrR family transcriptional regulator